MSPRYQAVAMRIADYIKHSIGDRFAQPTERELRYLLQTDAPVDYDQCGNVFIKLYWQRNYWKMVYFFLYEYSAAQLLKMERAKVLIASLGAGSGADTIATIVWLHEILSPGSVVALTLVDENKHNLQQAKKFIQLIRSLLPNIVLEVECVHTTIKNWETRKVYDYILLSHVLTENKRQVETICQKALSRLAVGGEVVVVERERDTIWQQASAFFVNAGVTAYDTAISTRKRDLLEASVTGIGETEITPHYVNVMPPMWSYQSQLVANYFKAWRYQSLTLLKRIFNSDASFDEKPDVEPTICGINNIVEYWREYPLQQTHIEVEIKNVAHGHNVAVCAFVGTFYTPRQHIKIQGAANFYFDPFQKKIAKLVEYFGTEKTPYV